MPEHSAGCPDFEAMLATIGAQSFFERYWQKRSLTLSIAKQEFERILQEVGPLDVRRFCGLAREGARAWLSNDFVAHSVIPVDESNAERFFQVGATLYFINVPLEPLTNALADFLGAPRKKVIASLFLTPAGGGAVPHFDKNENFTIQLTGAKEWIVDEVPSVASPADGYVLGQTVPPSLVPLISLTPEAKSHSVLMHPGSLLYVPRGAVHQTATGTLSWSLNLSYSPSMWLDLLLVGLRLRLSSSPRWRETVTGAGRGCNPHAADASILPALIRELLTVLDDPHQVADIAKQFLETPDG